MNVKENGRGRTCLVSVVIPTYKRADLVRKALFSLFEQDLDKEEYEIIVVDSSPDGSVVSAVRELQEISPCTLKYYVKEPEGPGPSRNLGARHSHGEFIAFMDSDCQASQSWLSQGLAAFQDGIGIVQGRTLPEPDVPTGGFTAYVVVDKESFLYETCNIFYRRTAWEEGGGFPRDLNPRAEHPMGGEDVELAWMVRRNGWETRFASDAVVFHIIVRISVLRWLVNKHMYIFPYLLKKFPELRQFHFGGYFYDKAQAFLLLAIIGFLSGFYTSYALLLCVPYAILRMSGPAQTLGGVLRLLRLLVYFVKDTISLIILLVGSIRFRTILI